MPLAAGNSVLVKVDKVQEYKGSIALPEKTRQLDRAHVDTGVVVMVGKDAYPEDEYKNGPWCKEGDKIYFTPGNFRVVNPSEDAEYEFLNPRQVKGFVQEHDRK